VVTSGSLGGLLPRVLLAKVGREVETLGVTSQYFRLLGQTIRGRDFTRDDNRSGAEPVAIISDRLWTRAFGRQSEAIGAIAAATPFPVRIIGVAPPGFEGARRGEHGDVWIPSNLVRRLVAEGTNIPEDGPTMVFARLHPGRTRAEAERYLVQNAVGEFDRRVKERIRVVPLTDVFGAPDSRTIVIREHHAARVVAGLAALVLLGGCATLMALVLVHYERRRRELAIRLALGASRKRLAADLSGELAWLMAGGAAGAVLIAVWSLRALPGLSLPGGVNLGRLDLSLDWRVLAMGFATTVLTLIVAALVPLSRFTRADLATELVASSSTTPPSSQRLRQVLLGLHVSATIVVLVSAGLFVRAVIYGFSAGPGFDVDRTAYVRVQVVAPFGGSGSLDEHMTRIAENTERLENGLRALAGVEAIAMGAPPIGSDQASLVLTPRTIQMRGERRELRVGLLRGSPELLPALGVPIVAGRALIAADDSASPRPVVLTASLARTLWPGGEALGQVFSFVGPRQGTFIVVGVAADIVYGSLAQPSSGVVVTVSPRAVRGMEPQFVVRTAHPDLLVQSLRKLVKDVVPDAQQVVIESGREIVARDLSRQRLGAWFFSGFGLVALMLGAGGVFGLVAYLAESRRREFGVRLALGATPRDLIWRGVAAGLTPVSIGTAAGLLVAALVTRVFVSSLPGLSALDPLTYASVALTMVGCATVAGIAAAWRLRHIAPGVALRAE
jgi:predicted permease